MARFEETDYREAAKAIIELAANAQSTRASIRAVAEELFDVRGVGIDRYARLYEDVLTATNCLHHSSPMT